MNDMNTRYAAAAITAPALRSTPRPSAAARRRLNPWQRRNWLKTGQLLARGACLIAFLLLPSSFILSASAQGTAFTYQGELSDSGGPINSYYDFTYTLYDSPGPGGNLIGSPNPNSRPNIPVNGGLFTNTLDFGSTAFTGGARWLQITVQPHAGGTLTTLSPRQQLTPSPYAIFAANAGGVASGSVVQSLNSLKDNVTLAHGANVTITTSGNTLTIDSVGAGGSGIWSLNGTSTYYNGGNVGIGTISPGGTLSLFNSASDTILKLEDIRADGSSSFLSKQAFYDYYSEAAYVGLRHNGGLSPGVRALVFGLSTANSGAASEVMRIADNGYVGIGTASPSATLDVRPIGFAINQNGGIQLATTDGHWPSGMFLRTDSAGNPRLALDIASSETLSLYGDNVGIGTLGPAYPLDVLAGQAIAQFTSTNAYYGSAIFLKNSTPGQASSGAISFFSAGFSGPAGNRTGNIAVNSDGTFHFEAGGYDRMQISPSGTVSVGVLQINGADVAEPFAVTSRDAVKGCVMAIDEDNPGQLKLSEHAYDTHVAGILSGANGVNSGILLKQHGFNDGGQNVALSGRVYALADASYGAIRPGDLLTTSDTPGHCMKVTDHAQAQGAIIGKAMSALKEGKGMVLVLVTLQ